MRRSAASPDAETPSYCAPPPCRMSVTISSDEPANFECTWQPVAFTNGLTHCLYVYPSHWVRFGCPPPLPIDVGRPFPWLMPAAGTHSAAATTADTTHPLFPVPPVRRCAQAASGG